MEGYSQDSLDGVLDMIKIKENMCKAYLKGYEALKECWDDHREDMKDHHRPDPGPLLEDNGKHDVEYKDIGEEKERGGAPYDYVKTNCQTKGKEGWLAYHTYL